MVTIADGTGLSIDLLTALDSLDADLRLQQSLFFACRLSPCFARRCSLGVVRRSGLWEFLAEKTLFALLGRLRSSNEFLRGINLSGKAFSL